MINVVGNKTATHQDNKQHVRRAKGLEVERKGKARWTICEGTVSF